MKINPQSLSNTLLFKNIDEPSILKLCECLSAKKFSYEKDSFIFHAGEPVQSVYLILSGSAHIIEEDFWGNRSIIETMRQGTFFGEAYVFAGIKKQLVTVITAEDSSILVMNPSRLYESCSKRCEIHHTLIQNTTHILAKKIVLLTQKVGHVIQRTTRAKLLSYLSHCAQQANSNSFYIPYSRQQLADYLSVDRSALSHELSKIKTEGMVRYRKNHFELLEDRNRWP